MRTNESMRHLLKETKNYVSVDLPLSLSELLDEGFVFIDNCIFLKTLYDLKGNANRGMFPDEVGYESFVNHLHIDDYVNDVNLSVDLRFAECLGLKWKEQNRTENIRVILSIDGCDHVIRFHSIRQEQELIDGNLESYKDAAILVVDY